MQREGIPTKRMCVGIGKAELAEIADAIWMAQGFIS